jgi:hypothetical protein
LQAVNAYTASRKNLRLTEAALRAQGMAPERLGPALKEVERLRKVANRAAGRVRLARGLISLVGGAVLTALVPERIFVGLLAVGGVYTLMGLVQMVSGADIGQ